MLTGRIICPDALLGYRFVNVAASAREGARDTVNANDTIAARAGEGACAAIREATGRYLATFAVGIDPTALGAGGGPGGGRPGEPPPEGRPPPETDGAAAVLVPGGG